jgi:hypothetical protein
VVAQCRPLKYHMHRCCGVVSIRFHLDLLLVRSGTSKREGQRRDVKRTIRVHSMVMPCLYFVAKHFLQVDQLAVYRPTRIAATLEYFRCFYILLKSSGYGWKILELSILPTHGKVKT